MKPAAARLWRAYLARCNRLVTQIDAEHGAGFALSELATLRDRFIKLYCRDKGFRRLCTRLLKAGLPSLESLGPDAQRGAARAEAFFKQTLRDN